MTRNQINRVLCFGLVTSAAIIAGCGQSQSYESQYYVLEAARDREPALARIDAALAVHRFSVDAAFAGRNLVYRRSEFRYETDYYHEVLIAPGTMIAERTRDWLADSGLFSRVLPASAGVKPTYTLEGSVTALYCDFTNESAPAAVVEIRFFLLGGPGADERVVFTQTYRAVSPVQDRTAKEFVAALNRSLVDILTRLEMDLGKVLAERSSQNTPPT
ncbi:MAG: hypothetical protein A2Y77_08465 [Planctomycetes bacterium RBG_13_62_9]|nr:MAG: hypothetical protein A2Y77_08465 [Planctomycetes bacterium RBG_13_62_9]